MTDSSKSQHKALRLLLILTNTLNVILCAAGREVILIVTLSFSLICILFNGAVYHHQTKDSVIRHSRSGYTRVASADDQTDEALIGSQHNDEDSTKDKPSKFNRTQRILMFCDTFGAILFLILHFLVAAIYSRWRSVMVAVEVGTICMFTAVSHALLVYYTICPAINEYGLNALKDLVPGVHQSLSGIRI